MRLFTVRFTQLLNLRGKNFQMEFHITLTILVLVPFTLSQNTIDADATLAGNFIKPIKNNGNTIKPVKNNVNNVYNVYVEQHHHFHTDEEKEEDQNEVERHAMAGQVGTGCMNVAEAEKQ